MRLSYQQFWFLLWAWLGAVPVKQLARLSGLHRNDIYRWFDLFRAQLPENPVILGKLVQLDEAFFKRQAVMAAKVKGGRACAAVVFTGHPQKQHVFAFARNYIAPYSQLNTDGGGHYRRIDSWWPVKHQYERHAKWEFALTSEIEGWFGNLRTFLRRMYHHVTPEKLPEYVREFSARFSSPEMFKDPRIYLQKTLSLVP